LRSANEVLRKGGAFVRRWSEDAGQAHIARKQNSTARSGNNQTQARPAHGFWYRVELQCIAERIIALLAHVTVKRSSLLAANRARRDAIDCVEMVRRVHVESNDACGRRKIWHQLRSEGKDIAWITVEHLMKTMGLQGVIRGRTSLRIGICSALLR